MNTTTQSQPITTDTTLEPSTKAPKLPQRRNVLTKQHWESFDIRNFSDRLEPAKEKNKYFCPVCKGNDLSIQPDTGKYQCFHGCECRDIREAVAPWAERRRSQPYPQRVLPKCGRKPVPEPVLLPSGELAIARLKEIPLDIPQPMKPQFTPTKRVKEDLLSKGVKEEGLKEITITTYDYGSDRKAHRYQAPADNSKGYEKTFAISRTDATGKTQWNKGKDSWAAYRQDEAIAALLAVPTGQIPVLLSHEGEKCVEALRALKLAGITTMGSSSLDDMALILDQIKSQMGDKVFILAHCLDNDKTGIEKAQKWAKACVRAQIPFVAIDLKAIKPDLCEKGDVVDILTSGMNGEELATMILEEIKSIRLDLEEHSVEFDSTPSDEVQSYDPPSDPVQSYDPNDPETFYKSICASLGLPFENCVTATAFDTWAYHREFTGAKNWRVIDSAFYKWSSEHQKWQHQPDNRVYTILCDIGEKAFKLVPSKEFGWLVKKPYGSNSHKESAFKYIRNRLERLEPLPANTHLQGFNNCVVDMRTGQQMPHNKDYFLTNIIPLDYKPGLECPSVFRTFIVDSFGEDMLEVIRAFTSMFLDPTAPYGRFPHLIGQSGGGKGTLGRFWSNLFGVEGSSSGSNFTDISTPEGRHQYLTGKRIFGFPDVGGYAKGVRAFYELVDNGSMSGRALFNPVAYAKQWFIRFWLASVDHLQIENAGDGWIRRAYPIPALSRNITVDPDLGLKLEACKADVISWALAMPRAERDRILMSKPESTRAVNLALDTALYADSTKSFVDLCLRPSPSPSGVSNSELHDRYTAYCLQHGYTPLGMSKFISHLKTVLPRNYIERAWTPTVNGRRERIAAHWAYLAPLPGAFFSPEKREDSGNYSPDPNPIVICVKSRCEEGGLSDFEDFWYPKHPEPAPSIPVHPVQSHSTPENDLGQPETGSQSGCPPCPSSPPPKSSYGEKEKNEKKEAPSQNPNSPIPLEQSEGGLDGTGWTGAPSKDRGLSTPDVDNQNSLGQNGQPLPVRNAAISLPELASHVRVNHPLHPDKGAYLCVVRYHGNKYVECEFLGGRKMGNRGLFSPDEIEIV